MHVFYQSFGNVLNVNSPITFSVQICILRSFEAFQFNSSPEVFPKGNPKVALHHQQQQQSHCFTGIEGVEQARKIQRAFVHCVIYHVAFSLHNKAVSTKLKDPKAPTNMQDKMTVQHSYPASAFKSSATAQGTAWERSQATEGGRFHAQQEWQRT